MHCHGQNSRSDFKHAGYVYPSTSILYELPRTMYTRHAHLLRIVALKQSICASANILDALQKRGRPNSPNRVILLEPKATVSFWRTLLNLFK